MSQPHREMIVNVKLSLTFKLSAETTNLEERETLYAQRR